MKKSTLYLKALTNVILYVIAAILMLVFVPRLIVFFMPFVIGWIISMIANPAVKFFEEKIKFKRKIGSILFIVLIIALIIFAGYGIIAFLISEGMAFVSSIPEKWPKWQASLDNFGSFFTSNFSALPSDFTETISDFGTTIEDALSDFISRLGSSTAIGSRVLSYISNGIGNLAMLLVGLIMCVLSAYFFTAEHNTLSGNMAKKIPESIYSKLMASYRGLKNAVGGYFVAQFKIEVWVYVITIIGLLICRVDYSFIIALGICIMDFLPFFGAGIIMIPWAVVCIVNAQYFMGIGILITWGVGQLVRQLIQPKIMGDTVGLKPLPTLIILYIGYRFSSVIGMIIAIPVAMIFVSLAEEGVFSTFLTSVKILWNGLNDFRHLDKAEAEKEEKHEEA